MYLYLTPQSIIPWREKYHPLTTFLVLNLMKVHGTAGFPQQDTGCSSHQSAAMDNKVGSLRRWQLKVNVRELLWDYSK